MPTNLSPQRRYADSQAALTDYATANGFTLDRNPDHTSLDYSGTYTVATVASFKGPVPPKPIAATHGQLALHLGFGTDDRLVVGVGCNPMFRRPARVYTGARARVLIRRYSTHTFAKLAYTAERDAAESEADALAAALERAELVAQRRAALTPILDLAAICGIQVGHSLDDGTVAVSFADAERLFAHYATHQTTPR